MRRVLFSALLTLACPALDTACDDLLQMVEKAFPAAAQTSSRPSSFHPERTTPCTMPPAT